MTASKTKPTIANAFRNTDYERELDRLKRSTVAGGTGGGATGPQGPPGPAGPPGPTIDATTTTKGVVQLAGDLTGTAASPQIAAGAVTDAEVATANKDGSPSVPGMRTLGTGPLQALPGSIPLNSISPPLSTLDMVTKRIANVGDPIGPGDAANKQYVDTYVQGLDAKASVRAAGTAAITLNGPQTVDGVACVSGDRVLAKSQAPASGNGIYLVQAGAWIRTTDADTWNELVSAFVFVEEGTLQKDTGWVCTNNPGGTLGSTSIFWTQFSSAGQIVAGQGLVLTGLLLDVQVDNATTMISGNQVIVKEDGITNWEIAPATIRDTEVAANNKDGPTNVPSMRTIGTGGQQAMAGATKLNQIPAPNATLDLASNKIVNLADPSGATDAVNKRYMDNLIQGLNAKESVIAATLGNVVMGSAPNILDGVPLGTGDRVLMKNQTTASQNGIYLVATVGSGANGSWIRANDADNWSELVAAYVFVEQGTQADTGWVCGADQPGVLGTDPVVWTQFSGAGQVIAGAGLTKTGNTLAVANNGITNAMIGDGAIDLATADVTGALPVIKGGTGSINGSGARVALGAAGVYSTTTHAAGTTVSVPYQAHLLRASPALIVQVQDAATGNVELPDINVSVDGDVTVTFAVSVAANSKRVMVYG